MAIVVPGGWTDGNPDTGSSFVVFSGLSGDAMLGDYRLFRASIVRPPRDQLEAHGNDGRRGGGVGRGRGGREQQLPPC